MSNIQQRFEHLKRKIDDLRRDADRAAGALTEHKARLKEVIGTDNLKEAKKARDQLASELAEARKQFEELLAKYEEYMNAHDGEASGTDE